MKKVYNIWVDIMKGIAIIAVVLLHVDYIYPEDINKAVLISILGDSWHMPLFYMIAGFFVSRERLTDPVFMVKNKFRKLHLRLLYYYVPFLLLHNVFLITGFYNGETEYGGKQMILYTFTDYIQKFLEVFFFMGREPYASPLWFVYVLFEAFISLSILSWIVKRITGETGFRWEITMSVTLILTSSISYSLTNIFDITIPRISNVPPAAWLIFLGMILKNRIKLNFDNKYLATASLAMLITVCYIKKCCMMTNDYHDIVHITFIAITATYFFAYIARKIEQNIIGKTLAYIGHHSFEIMSLHLISFAIFARTYNQLFSATLPFYKLGIKTDSLFLFMVLTLAGVTFPLGFASIYDTLRKTLRNND